MRSIALKLLLIVLILGGLGCVTEQVDPPAPKTVRQSTVGPDEIIRPKGVSSNITPGRAINDDASAIQLDRIASAMLLYYFVNKQLPPNLNELNAYASADQELSFVSPHGNLPYIYTPDGLRSPGQTREIILADPVPTKGKRFCIFHQPGNPGGPLILEVQDISEPLYLGFRPPQ